MATEAIPAGSYPPPDASAAHHREETEPRVSAATQTGLYNTRPAEPRQHPRTYSQAWLDLVSRGWLGMGGEAVLGGDLGFGDGVVHGGV